MQHMPYERMKISDEENEESSSNLSRRQAAPEDEPGRTPHTAEGKDVSERKMPLQEPGRTPDAAEGE